MNKLTGMSFEVKQVGPCLTQVGASIQPIYDQAKETYIYILRYLVFRSETRCL